VGPLFRASLYLPAALASLWEVESEYKFMQMAGRIEPVRSEPQPLGTYPSPGPLGKTADSFFKASGNCISQSCKIFDHQESVSPSFLPSFLPSFVHFSEVLGLKPRAVHVVSTYSPTELHPWPKVIFSMVSLIRPGPPRLLSCLINSKTTHLEP
jgi:hypothetical protein